MHSLVQLPPFLFNGATLQAAEINFLVRQGNQAPGYDIGDFRAWVLSDASLPLALDVGRETVRLTVRLETTSTPRDGR